MHSLVKRKICLVENIFVEKNQSAGDDFMGDTIFGKYIYIFFFLCVALRFCQRASVENAGSW